MPNNADSVDLFADSTKYYNTVSIEATIDDPKYAVSGAGSSKTLIIVAAEAGDDLNDLDAAIGSSGLFD